MKELIKQLKEIIKPRCSFKLQFLLMRKYHKIDDDTALQIIKYIVRKLKEQDAKRQI